MVDRASRRAAHVTTTIVFIDSIPIEHLFSLSCPALQLSTPKTKRVRFSQQYKADGKRLAAILRALTAAYPRYAVHLKDITERVKQESERTRDTDRNRILAVLGEWSEGIGARDIMEDTGLSEHDVRTMLADLMRQGKVEEIRPPKLPGPRNWAPFIYRLKRTNHKR